MWNDILVNFLLNRQGGDKSPLSIILGHKPKYYTSDQDTYNIYRTIPLCVFYIYTISESMSIILSW